MPTPQAAYLPGRRRGVRPAATMPPAPDHIAAKRVNKAMLYYHPAASWGVNCFALCSTPSGPAPYHRRYLPRRRGEARCLDRDHRRGGPQRAVVSATSCGLASGARVSTATSA
jgi:hypothetical protein